LQAGKEKRAHLKPELAPLPAVAGIALAALLQLNAADEKRSAKISPRRSRGSENSFVYFVPCVVHNSAA